MRFFHWLSGGFCVFSNISLMGDRSMVGQWTLTPRIKVRILIPQPEMIGGLAEVRLSLFLFINGWTPPQRIHPPFNAADSAFGGIAATNPLRQLLNLVIMIWTHNCRTHIMVFYLPLFRHFNEKINHLRSYSKVLNFINFLKLFLSTKNFLLTSAAEFDIFAH